jgi:hypothetical protein
MLAHLAGGILKLTVTYAIPRQYRVAGGGSASADGYSLTSEREGNLGDGLPPGRRLFQRPFRLVLRRSSTAVF